MHRRTHINWKTIGLFGLLVLVAVFPLWSEDQNTAMPSSAYDPGLDRQGVFERANAYYRDGDLETSLEGYTYLAELGVRNGYLFYNLGNVYFRLGDVGSAMLWYERALKYLPRYEDLKVNYEYALTALVDEEFSRPEYGGTVGFFLKLHGLLNLRESIVLTVVLFWFVAVFFIMRALIRNVSIKAWLRIPCWVVGIAFIISCLSSAIKTHGELWNVEAIIMSPAVEIKTGPGEEFSTSFSLHEGFKVSLIQEQDGWKRIVLPGNTTFTGWLPAKDVEAI